MKIKIALISLLFIPVLAFAQSQAVLPNAGLTPESPFYFIDKLGEALRAFFTFNPEGKARLQITLAAERVAEIKVMLETKGVEARGLEVAETRLREHLGDAAEIVIKQKSKGKDVSKLAKELDDDFDEAQSALEQSFKEQERTLEARKDELKQALKETHRAGDTAKEEALAQELGQVKTQLELLELKEEELEDELKAEEEKLEEEIEASSEAEQAIGEAQEEKQEVIEEAQEEGVELPVNAFADFDSLISQAQNAFVADNYQDAERLAEQAEDTLEDVEDITEELEEEREELEDEEDEDENEVEIVE